jgi:tRNA(Arg) A34 adenosine deaminase TadA
MLHNKLSSNSKLVFTNEYFMRLALQEAERAYLAGEMSAGVIVVSQNGVIAVLMKQNC